MKGILITLLFVLSLNCFPNSFVYDDRFDINIGLNYRITPIEFKPVYTHFGQWIPMVYENKLITGTRIYYSITFPLINNNCFIRFSNSLRYTLLYIDENRPDPTLHQKYNLGYQVNKLTADVYTSFGKVIKLNHFYILLWGGYTFQNLGSSYSIKRTKSNGTQQIINSNFNYSGFIFGGSVQNSNIECGLNFVLIPSKLNKFVYFKTFMVPAIEISYNLF